MGLLRKQITKKWTSIWVVRKLDKKTCTKYLGGLIEKHLLLKDHIKILKQKLNEANGTLGKLRYHLPSDILKTVYYSLFDTHLCYACQVWGQTTVTY